MALLRPRLTLQYQAAKNQQWGLTTQRTHIGGDNVAVLLGQPDVILDGFYLEPNTSSVILAPVIRSRAFGLAQVDVSPSVTPLLSGAGKFRTVENRKTGDLTLSQYDATADVAWAVQTKTQVLDIPNAGFSVDLYLGAPPKATTDRSKTGIYRKVTWCSDGVAGDNIWRVTVPYQAAATLERSTDAGATWAVEATLDSGIDLSTIRNAGNVKVSVSVMVIGRKMAVWLGDGIDGAATVIRKNASYAAGKIKIEGSGGTTDVGFSRILNEKEGHLISYEHFGPADMATPVPEFHFHGTSAADLTTASQTITGSIEATFPATTTFKYRATMTSPAAASPDDDYSATTPYWDQVTIVWPKIYIPPSADPWLDLEPHAYEEREIFDPATRILRRYCKITARIYAGEQHPVHGVDAVRAYLSYQHEIDLSLPESLRGYFIGGTEARLYSVGGDSFIDYEAHDLWWLIEPEFLHRRMFPGRWCVFAVVRALLEAAGIVPDFYDTLPRDDLGSDFCAFGPDPAHCSHTKVGVHPGWPERFSIMSALTEMADYIFAWMGIDALGQFRFEEFDPTSYTDSIVDFTEHGSAPDPAFGGGYDEIGQPGGGVLQRLRSMTGLKNDGTFVGVDEVSGAFIVKHWRDDQSVNDQGAFNYVGSIRSFMQFSTLYLSDSFTQEALDRTTKWARLPYDETLIPCLGQPDLFPTPEMGKLVTAYERRTLGPDPINLFVIEVIHQFTAPGTLLCFVRGLWPGVGDSPGAPKRPPALKQGSDDPGPPTPIPEIARRNQGSVISTGPH